MTRPLWIFVAIGLFLALLGAGAVLLGPGLLIAFEANVPLNSLILTLLAFGVLIAFWQVLEIDRAVVTLEAARQGVSASGHIPHLIIPIASYLRASRPLPMLSATNLRAMLDGVSARLDESRDISRYLMNVLILLGLLGTFWGLLQTVSGIGAVITSLHLGEGDIKAVFDQFKHGLERPLGGMGISFSASLFGLASSLVLGFLDLQCGRAQTRFGIELEEWLSHSVSVENSAATTTQLPTALTAPAGEAYSNALVQGLIEHLDRLQRHLAVRDELVTSERAALRELRESIGALGEQVQVQNAVMHRLAEAHLELRPALRANEEQVQRSIAEPLRRIDTSLRETVETLAAGRSHLSDEIRQEIRSVARILSNLIEPQDRR